MHLQMLEGRQDLGCTRPARCRLDRILELEVVCSHVREVAHDVFHCNTQKKEKH
ncbi:MAG: hypothetical protein ABW185_02680 [Sedimenticola sp.]